MAYDNTNRGVLFVNDRKETDKQPDYKGSINIGGKEFWLSGWKHTSAAGNTYLSLSVQPKEDQVPQVKDDGEEDIPF